MRRKKNSQEKSQFFNNYSTSSFFPQQQEKFKIENKNFFLSMFLEMFIIRAKGVMAS